VSAPAKGPSLPLHLLVALVLMALLIVASCFARQLGGQGGDFAGYFMAAGRWLLGESPYVYERPFSYQHAPVIVLPFTVFHFLGFESARWVYAALHAFVALAAPYALYRVLETDTRLRIGSKPELFAMGLLTAFLASFRFIDSEFRVSQINLWTMGILISGLWLLQNAGHRFVGRIVGLALLSLASLVKIQSAIFFITFAKWRSWKTWAAVFGVLVGVALLPDPRLWVDWAEQLRNTAYNLSTTTSASNLQGFYPLAVTRLGFKALSVWPVLLTLPFFAMVFFSTARYSLRDLQSAPLPVLLSISTWLLLGFMASPIPLQHTYSILWVLIPLSWVAATRRERRWILGIALFLGLTPQGIVGKVASDWLESRQSVFAAILVFWFILLRQASRWRIRSTH
jgi:hypothetical protein